jgi:adenylate cyclase, class 2
MIEVEVKSHVLDFNQVKKMLIKIGAEYIKTEYQEDTYFNAPHRDFAKTDEAFRIRKIPQDEKAEIILTYKGAKIDKVSKTRKEIEVNVGDDEKIALIMENLGFQPVGTIKKERAIYLFDGYTISLDHVHQVGKFMEIEKEAREGDNFKDSLDEIFEIYKMLGITEGFERRSYLEMLGIYKD